MSLYTVMVTTGRIVDANIDAAILVRVLTA